MSATTVGYHTKVVTFCVGQENGYIFVKLCDFSKNNHGWKRFISINSENVWSGYQKMGLVFHKLHLTENMAGVPKPCFHWSMRALHGPLPNHKLASRREMFMNKAIPLLIKWTFLLIQPPYWKLENARRWLRRTAGFVDDKRKCCSSCVWVEYSADKIMQQTFLRISL